jgi:hypothetical protein
METIRYRPGEAIRWIQIEAERIRLDAKAQTKSATDPVTPDFAGFQKSVKNAAGAVFNLGRSAYAEIAKMRASESEYVLLEDRFDIVRGNSLKSIMYSEVKKILIKGDKATLMLEKSAIIIKPFAQIVAGPLKVPIGWSRNGLEVPYHLIIEELSARCQLDIELA